MSRVRTGLGDTGFTQFRKRQRISKRTSVVRYLNSLDKIAVICGPPTDEGDVLSAVFYRMIDLAFCLGTLVYDPANEIATKKVKNITQMMIQVIDESPCDLTGFIISSKINERMMLARCMVREAESYAVEASDYLGHLAHLDSIKALNVLSDYLFIFAWAIDENPKYWNLVDDTND